MEAAFAFFLGRAGRSAERLIADAEITHGNHPRFSRLHRTFQCLAVSRQPLKLLETLEIRVLKRLASAVQLRPWPPCFQYLAFAFSTSALSGNFEKMGLSWVEECAPTMPQNSCNQRVDAPRNARERSLIRLRSQVLKEALESC